jgi:hypothetical protein
MGLSPVEGGRWWVKVNQDHSQPLSEGEALAVGYRAGVRRVKEVRVFSTGEGKANLARDEP